MTAAPAADPEPPASGVLAGPWHLDPAVALRPEPFGALAYHYGSRRLTFLRSPVLVDLVRRLADFPTVDQALESVVPAARRRSHRQALDSLAGSGFIRPGAAPDAAPVTVHPPATTETEQARECTDH